MAESKVVLVTGASTGIGRSIAEYLAAHHFTVFGTSRNPEVYTPPSGWSLIALDVCSDESVQSCVQGIFNRTGHLDVLINNAGYALDGALEEATIEQVKDQFETNYFGMLRLTKAVLPIMRAQSGGNIINISSGSASTRFPFMGHYAATKCALEGYSETLRQEVEPFGIHVSVVEPAFFKSNIIESVQLGEDIIEQYEPLRTAWLKAIRSGVRNGPDPVMVAHCVMRILGSKKPRFMYFSGPQVRLGAWGHHWLPEKLYHWISRTNMGVKPG